MRLLREPASGNVLAVVRKRWAGRHGTFELVIGGEERW
jgi:hypothetical protein